MALLRRRPLLRAAMAGGVGYAVGRLAVRSARVDALVKLKDLFESGVLTREQYEAERRRLTHGM
jgi:Short C-terminal domain